MTYPTGEPWGGSLDRDHSAPRPPSGAGAPGLRRRIAPGTVIGGGVAVALALGLAFGLLAKPDFGARTAPAPMRAVTPAPDAPSVGRMNIEIASPAPTPLLASAGKLEVLPAGMARDLPPPPPAPPAQRLTSVYVPLAPAPVANPQPAPVQTVARDPACGSGSLAAQMVCADPQLAAADRELTRTYRQALRADAEPEQLRADQRDWLAAREEAARRSPGAVASVYRQRIDELNQLIEDGPG